ncbi:hypothetical protein BG015_004654 [Linnemannia schmuckeri]|uniref:Uncharacterized protein n=1 Tax=Linnemannia schmuckeri TaxID=64567 RepID=A0A9P5RCI0_9FUNG|nr:hypothetical protein BG015_004654 [Linnemannia schmuckeri]
MPKFLANNSDNAAEFSSEHFLVQTIRKYGHFIRYLMIHHLVRIDTALLSKACPNLLSFEIFDFVPYTAIWKRVETVVSFVTNAEESPLLSPLFEGVFVPSSLEIWSGAQGCQDRLTVQRFWLLVQQHAFTLQKLRLDRSLNVLARIASVDFLREMVTSLERLTNFENQSDIVNVGNFLDRLSHLQNLVTLIFHLAGLESLQVIGLSWDSITVKEINTIMDGTRSNLRTLEYLFSGFQYMPTEKRILPWLSNLRKLVSLQIFAETASNLVKFCPLLEEYHEWNHGEMIHPESHNHHLNALAPLLRGCPHLRVINEIQQRMDVNELLNHPWVVTDLKVFRVQIIKVPRCATEQQEQTQILEKLDSLLPRLRVLDLNYEYRQVNLADDHYPRMETVGRKKYIM